MALPVLFSGCSEDKDKLSLNTSDVSLYVEDTKELTASEKVEWSSESNFIAKVSDKGLLTANHVGKTFVTATCANGTEKCIVEVKAKYNTFVEPVLA